MFRGASRPVPAAVVSTVCGWLRREKQRERSLDDYPVHFRMPSAEAPMPCPPDHTAGRKADFVLPSAEGSLGYPEDMLTAPEPKPAGTSGRKAPKQEPDAGGRGTDG